MGNPYGVIFDGTKKAYVGSHHGKAISLTPETKEQVRELADTYGVWYEGDGGDVAVNTSLFGPRSKYQGSWDDAFTKTIKGYPAEYLSPMFSNVAANEMKADTLAPATTIFESILKNQEGNRYFKDRKFDASTLTKFLQKVSDNKYDFVAMAKKRATKENVSQFFDAGEERMFPPNWDKYPYPAGKMMKKVEDARNQFLLDQKSGVYVVGAGHLIELLRMDKTLRMTGGQKAAA